MKAMDEHHFDSSRLAAMAIGAGKSESELLAEFCRGNAADAALMMEAAGLGDYAQVEVISHRLRGCAMMFGARHLAAACAGVSAATKTGKANLVRLALDAFDRDAAVVADRIAERKERGEGATRLTTRAPSARLCAGLSILAVDDHDFQRELIVQLLRRLGAAEVLGVADGASALKELSNPAHSRDIVILDLSMPEVMDGIELMQALGKCEATPAVILNSAQQAEHLKLSLQIARRCGLRVLGALAKPLTATNLSPLVAAYRATRCPQLARPEISS